MPLLIPPSGVLVLILYCTDGRWEIWNLPRRRTQPKANGR